MSRHNAVYQSIFNTISDTVIKTPISISQIYKEYEYSLRNTSDVEIEQHSVRTLKKTISERFQDEFKILPQKGNSDLITASFTTLQEL